MNPYNTAIHIHQVRESELAVYFKGIKLSALNYFMINATPTLVTISTFTVYSLIPGLFLFIFTNLLFYYFIRECANCFQG